MSESPHLGQDPSDGGVVTDVHSGTTRHLVLVGPTASGKSSLAMAIARSRQGRGDDVELVSMDSMAVYRGMDIGTTTPSRSEQDEVPHHLIDLVEPDQEFSVAEFVAAVRSVLDDIEGRGAMAILVGGTGLYVRAVVDRLELPGRFPETAARIDSEPDTRLLHQRLARLDPVAASRMEQDNRRRIVRALEVTEGSGRPFSSFGPGLDTYPETPFVLAGLRVQRELLARSIGERVRAQLADGFLDEVRELERRVQLSRTASQALGYGELAAHLRGECSLEEAADLIEARSRKFAVRQIRWFRRDPRIRWFDHGGDPLSLVDDVDSFWSDHRREGSSSR